MKGIALIDPVVTRRKTVSLVLTSVGGYRIATFSGVKDRQTDQYNCALVAIDTANWQVLLSSHHVVLYGQTRPVDDLPAPFILYSPENPSAFSSRVRDYFT